LTVLYVPEETRSRRRHRQYSSQLVQLQLGKPDKIVVTSLGAHRQQSFNTHRGNGLAQKAVSSAQADRIPLCESLADGFHTRDVLSNVGNQHEEGRKKSCNLGRCERKKKSQCYISQRDLGSILPTRRKRKPKLKARVKRALRRGARVAKRKVGKGLVKV